MRGVGWSGILAALSRRGPAACSAGRPVHGAAGGPGAGGQGGGAFGAAGGDSGGDAGSGGQLGDPDGGMPLSPPPDLGPPPPFQPLAAGERPRLFFRSYDLPMLKAKAASGQGAALIARLKASLGGGEALRQAARRSGCTEADIVKLTKAERDACAETLGAKHKNGPALYAAIDPDKKAAFDGDCEKDDDWCLYRTGKGPYPGLIALGRKKKIKGWD